MTRKHFRAIAQAMYELKQQTTSQDSLCVCVDKIADVCASQNPRFNRAKFIEACEKGL